MTLWTILLPFAALVAGGGRKEHAIEIRAMAFHPDTLTVQLGDTIVWLNQDIVPHTATSDGQWDTGTIMKGDTGRYIPRETGTLAYICTLHPTMRGTLIIRKERS